jgi:protoheme ferro-lyase
MIYAHIFKAHARTGKKFVLILSTGFVPDGTESLHDSKAEAKAAAKAAGAKAWNY